MQNSLVVYWYQNGFLTSPPEIMAPIALSVDGVVSTNPRDSANFIVSHDSISAPISTQDIRDYPTYGGWVFHEEKKGMSLNKRFSSLDEVRSLYWSQDRKVTNDADAENNLREHNAYLQASAELSTFIRCAKFNSAILLGGQQVEDKDIWCRSEKVDDIKYSFNAWLLVLMLAGINISLPRIRIDNVDVIQELREKSNDERIEYQAYIRELLFDGESILLSNPPLEEVCKWADFVSNTKILPSVLRLETSIKSRLTRGLWEKLGASLLDRSPSLVASTDGVGTSSKILSTLALEIISIIAPKIFQHLVETNELKKSFGLAYLYHLRRELK